jgi:hypothetical protein
MERISNGIDARRLLHFKYNEHRFSGIPRIISHQTVSISATDRRRDLRALVNRKGYEITFHGINMHLQAMINYDELTGNTGWFYCIIIISVTDFHAIREDGQAPRTSVKIENFDQNYVQKEVSFC